MRAAHITRYGTLASRATPRPTVRNLSRSTAVGMSGAQQVLAAGSAEPAAGPDRMHPLFITTWSCPYAQRSWIALNAKGLEYNAVFVDLQNKPEWFFKHNEYGRVPTLVWKDGDNTRSLYESLIVNEYINDLPGPSLLPQDPTDRAQARLLIDQFGAKFGSSFAKVMFAADAESAAPAVADLEKALHWLEEQASAEGPFLLGKDFSLVDAATIPFYIRLQCLEKMGLFKIPTGLPKLSAWCEAAQSHPAVTGSIQPPDSTTPYLEQMVEVYKEYIARRKAAAAAQ